MNYFKHVICSLAMFASMASFAAEEKPQVLIKTEMGDIYLELYPEKAPITVANFLNYVDNHFYDGLIFHRVLPRFMVQTGGFRFDYSKKDTEESIVNESNNGLSNSCGTVAMARLGHDVDTASSQFFININNNPHLNAKKDNDGYAVFGKVIKGMRIAEAIGSMKRGMHKGVFQDAPNIPMQILKIKRVEGQKVYKAKCEAKSR